MIYCGIYEMIMMMNAESMYMSQCMQGTKQTQIISWYNDYQNDLIKVNNDIVETNYTYLYIGTN